MRLREFNQLESLIESFQSVTWTLYEADTDTVVRTSNLFNVNDYDSVVAEKFKDFVATKMNNLALYGSRDSAMNSKAPLGNTIDGLRHAHLTQDVSVFYRIHGRDPRYLDIYGLFRHQDSGTGNTPNIKRQKKLAQKFSNAKF